MKTMVKLMKVNCVIISVLALMAIIAIAKAQIDVAIVLIMMCAIPCIELLICMLLGLDHKKFNEQW